MYDSRQPSGPLSAVSLGAGESTVSAQPPAPGPSILAQAARARVRDVEQRLGLEPRGALSAQVRDVVILASSSRGGSSMLAEVLRHTPQLLHFRAEVNPFF